MQILRDERRYVGVPLSGGVAFGRSCMFVPAAAAPVAGSRGAAREARRLRDAVERLTARLDAAAREADGTLGQDAAAILLVQCEMLRDPALRDALAEAVEGAGSTAERALCAVFARFRERFSRDPSGLVRERAVDLAELERNLLTELGRAPPTRRCRQIDHCPMQQCLLRNPHILVISELTPALVTEVDDLTLGLLTERGGPTSHAAILARAAGLPAVCIEDVFLRVPLEADLLIDGDRGEVIVSPRPETVAGYAGRFCTGPRGVRASQPVPGLEVLANVDRAADLGDVLAARAEGVGLYRTEMEALALGRLLDEEEQYGRYAAAVDAMGGRPVYLRLLDLGGDKSAGFLGIPHEENPALGLRGARLLLARPELLRTQARALVRASRRGSVHVIAPMIVDAEQFVRIKAIVCEEAERLDAPPPPLGAMFEVPSACVLAREILKVADFGCVGTNDLTQYLLAMDRANASVAAGDAHGHPALWAVLEDLARAAQESGRRLSVCGELAGDVRFTARLMRTGVRHVSVAPRVIAEVRAAARAVPTGD